MLYQPKHSTVLCGHLILCPRLLFNRDFNSIPEKYREVTYMYA